MKAKLAKKRLGGRIRFSKNFQPELHIRTVKELYMHSVELHDISSSGVAFKVGANECPHRIGDFLFGDLGALNMGEISCTLKVSRILHSEHGYIVGAQFISIPTNFKDRVGALVGIRIFNGMRAIKKETEIHSLPFQKLLTYPKKPLKLLVFLIQEWVHSLRAPSKLRPYTYRPQKSWLGFITNSVDTRQIL